MVLSATCYTIFFTALLAIQYRFDRNPDLAADISARRDPPRQADTKERSAKRWAEEERLYRESMEKKRAKKDAKKAKERERAEEKVERERDVEEGMGWRERVTRADKRRREGVDREREREVRRVLRERERARECLEGWH